MSLSQAEWVELVAKWRQSGKSANQFATEHGVTTTALRYWINRPPTRNARPKAETALAVKGVAATPSLARVVRPGETPPDDDRGGEVRLVIGKVTIVVEPGFDDAHLRAVVRALSEVG
jgi:transposase-like protein